MNDTAETRPMGTIQESWRQYKSWAATARKGKRDQDRARNLTLILGLLGAVSATGAGMIALERWDSELSILSGILIAAATFLGKELLTPERETIWARCRMVAESVKRQAWLALMQAPPYDGDAAATRLAEMTQRLVQGEKLTRETRATSDTELEFPEVKTIEEYIDARVQSQIDWYRARAKSSHASLARWRAASLLLGLAAVLLGGIGASDPAFTAWVPVVTSTSAAVLALVQAGRLQSIPPLYQQTADQLAIQIALWKDGAHRIRSDVEFVTTCEDIIAHENESWRTEWLSKEEMDKARKAYERVQKSLPKTGESAPGTTSSN